MSRPGTSVVVSDALPPTAAATDTGVGFMVGEAEHGPVDEPVLVRSLDSFTDASASGHPDRRVRRRRLVLPRPRQPPVLPAAGRRDHQPPRPSRSPTMTTTYFHRHRDPARHLVKRPARSSWCTRGGWPR